MVIIIYIPVSIYRRFLSIRTAFALHVRYECSRRVYFMKFRQGYIIVRKKAEERGETREETRRREGKKEKTYELGIFGETSDFNVF